MFSLDARDDVFPVRRLTEFSKAEDVTPDPVEETEELAAETPEVGENELVIPEDLATLTDAELTALAGSANEAFDALYSDGKNLSDEDFAELATLTEGIESLNGELATRETAAASREEEAAKLAARVRPAGENAVGTGDDEADAEADVDAPGELANDKAKKKKKDDEDDEEDKSKKDKASAETATAARKGPTRVNLSRAAARRQIPTEVTPGPASTMSDIVRVAGQGTGFTIGQGVDWGQAAVALDKRLSGVNVNQLRNAARSGRTISQRESLLQVHKPFAEGLVINDVSGEHVESVLKHAASEHRLSGNSLVASGGWCAPSETIYDLLEVETRDGLYSLPEVNITRGGINRTLGPDFADLFSQITGWSYTEAQDAVGQYETDADGVGTGTGEGAAAGTKPCFHIDCPDFEEFRLGVEGLCITAGLLQQRGYPELVARTIRGALVAHDHRVAGRVLSEVVAGSQAVIMPVGQAGATAPILSAIELQVEWLRTKTRMSRAATVEGVFPYWVRSVIRVDLARRNGVDLVSVSDAQINGWFSALGVSPQFNYNWQDLDTSAPLTAWPTEISFLLYPAGAWVRGNADIITLDTLYDSTLLGTNDYTALWTEEGVVTIPMGHESLVVTTDFCADGATAAAVDIDCDGTTIIPVEPTP